MAQDRPQPPIDSVEQASANPNDVNSMDNILAALYDVISGDSTKKRDWDRFRSLFHPDARLIPSGKNPQTGVTRAIALTAEDYIKRAEPVMAKEGFFERELARKTETFGAMTHVFSTYQSFHKADDKMPFARGINSIQLLNDGKRWYIISIYWFAETPEIQLPKKYLKGKN